METGQIEQRLADPQLEPASAAAFSLNGAILALAPNPMPGQAYAKLLAGDDWGETGRLDFPLAGEQTSPLFGLAFEPNGAILVGSQCVLQSSGGQQCTPNQNHLQFQRTMRLGLATYKMSTLAKTSHACWHTTPPGDTSQPVERHAACKSGSFPLMARLCKRPLRSRKFLQMAV